MRFKDFKQDIVEGVYDQGIFKAFFLAGGAGSGKSYSASSATGSSAGKFKWDDNMETLEPGKVGPYGLKVVNSDEQLEYGLMKARMSSNMKGYTDLETARKERIRKRSKKTTAKREQLWVRGRLGLIIDGTAHDIRKLGIRKKELEDVGYDTYMIFVNTSLDIALQQNQDRARKLPDAIVARTWEEVQGIKHELANLFPGGFVEIVNNRAGENTFTKAFVEVGKLIKRPPSKPAAKLWMANELESKRR